MTLTVKPLVDGEVGEAERTLLLEGAGGSVLGACFGIELSIDVFEKNDRGSLITRKIIEVAECPSCSPWPGKMAGSLMRTSACCAFQGGTPSGAWLPSLLQGDRQFFMVRATVFAAAELSLPARRASNELCANLERFNTNRCFRSLFRLPALKWVVARK